MTAGLTRRLFSSSSRARVPCRQCSNNLTSRPLLNLKTYQRTITDIRPHQAAAGQVWFTSGAPRSHPEQDSDHKPPDERTLKLGNTIRVLQEHLPKLLATPLPQDILSPHITLHLFPSTHPHLPTVKGKIAYTAALWTAPVAWGRFPVVGNVKLDIISERMVKNGGMSRAEDARQERLIVKWKTCGKSLKSENPQDSKVVEEITKMIARPNQADDEFTGLFIFEFDEEGRILNHTIEHVDEGSNFEKTAKVISVTDWLLGRAWGRRSDEGTPGLAFAKCEAQTSKSPPRTRQRD